MPVFISHSFDNKPEFENLADALTAAGVEFWNPAEVKPGSSLRDQLRRAVSDCGVCVFVATRAAVKSSWCGAELGAFWGSGKPVIVYLAEASLSDSDLPPIVQGDVWERKISVVVRRASELLASSGAAELHGSQKSGALVGDMTAGQLERIIVGAISLAAANAKETGGFIYGEMDQAAREAVASATEVLKAAGQTVDHADDVWRKHLLWVDDRPDNNIYERRAFEALGVSFTLALSTAEALKTVSGQRFGAILSDMGRKEGPREGYVLLDALRSQGDTTPFFIYAGSNHPKHKREAEEHGAQGCTNNATELLEMVRRVIR